MPNVSNTGMEAGEWFERLPSEADRRMITGVVAMAHEFDWGQGHDMWGEPRHSLPGKYLAIYAIGSRSLGQEGPESDVDVLVAHNLSFIDACLARYPDFQHDLDASDEGFTQTPEWRAASDRDHSFRFTCLSNDPVAGSVATGVAHAADIYRLPRSFDGNLPSTYQQGGREHKAIIRYVGEDGSTLNETLSPLDLVIYKGWHREGRRLCGPKCGAAGYEEGSSPERFETLIDTDEQGRPLPRIPLYVLEHGVKDILIPQIEDVVKTEQERVDELDGGWRFRRSWVRHFLSPN